MREGGCVADTDCPQGYACVDGRCVELAGCRTDADCPSGYVCGSGGRCVAVAGCQTDADCPQGYICSSGSCVESGVGVDLREGLVLELKFDECSGDVARNTSGMGNDGTIYGAVWVDLGGGNCALKFDGIDDYVVVQDSPDFDSPHMTISAWIKPEIGNCPGDKPFGIVSKHSDETNAQMLFRLERDCKLDIGWTIGDKFYDLSGGSCYPGGGCNDKGGAYAIDITGSRWYFVVARYDGSKISLFVDGKLVAELGAMGEIVSNDYKLTIGAYASNPNRENFEGLIDNVRIWKRSLTEQEIVDIYNSEKNSYGQVDSVIYFEAVQVALGNYHTCAVKTDGTLLCWGRNDYGQLGMGDTTDRHTPERVKDVQ